MLKMKRHCERCQSPTKASGVAYICSYEGTFCEPCANAMGCLCPNCSGELVRRPVRLKQPLDVVASQIRKKLFRRKA